MAEADISDLEAATRIFMVGFCDSFLAVKTAGEHFLTSEAY